MADDTVTPCALCPDWTAWERDLKKAAIGDATPIDDASLDQFRHALADVHCKSSGSERFEVEYRLQRFGAKLWRRILARLDEAEARLASPAPDAGLVERARAMRPQLAEVGYPNAARTMGQLADALASLSQGRDGLVGREWPRGTRVSKIKGSSWTGKVVGFYSTDLTPEGYAVESENEPGSVQIYPRAALREASQ